MDLTISQLARELDKVNLDDILSCWHWALHDMRAVVTISNLGDLFLLGEDNAVYWLQTDDGQLTKIADNFEHYQQLLSIEDNIDNWFLPGLIEKLIHAGKTLKENEVYSYIKPPIIGGDYSPENIQPADMSVHFAFTGQIFEQMRDLPDGTAVSIKYNPNGLL